MRHPDPDDRVDGDPGWDEEKDAALAEELRVLPQTPFVMRWRRGVFVLDAVGEEGEREQIDPTVDEEGARPEDLPEGPRKRRPCNKESAERRHLKECDHAPAQLLVVAGARRNVGED